MRKILNIYAEPPSPNDPKTISRGFFRVWCETRGIALLNCYKLIKQLEHDNRVLKFKLNKRSLKIQKLGQNK